MAKYSLIILFGLILTSIILGLIFWFIFSELKPYAIMLFVIACYTPVLWGIALFLRKK